MTSKMTFAVLREWRDTSLALKRFFFNSLFVGIVFTIVCVTVDIKGSWDGLPFLINLMSNIAGALFGLPVALVILSRMSAYQTERTNRLRTERLLVKAVQNLDNDIYSLISLETHKRDANDGLFYKFRELSALETRLLDVVESSSNIADEYGRLHPESPLQVAAKEYADARAYLCYRLYSRFGATRLRKADVWRNNLRERWRYIDQVVRYQYYSFGSIWPISSASEIRMAKAVALELTPITLLQLVNQAYNEGGLYDLRVRPDPERKSLDSVLGMITSKANAERAIRELEELSELFHALDSVAFDIVQSDLLQPEYLDSWSPAEKDFLTRHSLGYSIEEGWRWGLD